jgi:hypothetical protein
MKKTKRKRQKENHTKILASPEDKQTRFQFPSLALQLQEYQSRNIPPCAPKHWLANSKLYLRHLLYLVLEVEVRLVEVVDTDVTVLTTGSVSSALRVASNLSLISHCVQPNPTA